MSTRLPVVVFDAIRPERAYWRAVGSLIPFRTAARIRGVPSYTGFFSGS